MSHMLPPAERRFVVRLLILNLLLLVVAASAVWWWWPANTTRRQAVVAEHPALPPLALESVEQISWTPGQAARLRVLFNAPPRLQEGLPQLEVRDAADQPLVCRIERPGAGGRFLVLLTPPLDKGPLTLTLGVGALPDSSVLTHDAATRATRVVCNLDAALRLVRLEAESPAQGDCAIEAALTQEPEGDLAPFVSVEPPVAFQVSGGSRWWSEERGLLRLVGDFTPGVIYRLTLRAGLPAHAAAPLAETVSRRVQIPDRRPQLAFVDEGRYLSPHGKLTVACQAVNVRRCTITLSRVYDNNLVRLALRESGRENSYSGYTPSRHAENLADPELTRTMELPDRPNATVPFSVDLAAFGAVPRGILTLRLSSEQGTAERLLSVSDLGLTARLGADSLLAWVTSLRDGQPLAGAAVSLWSTANQVLARGVTEADGTITLRFEQVADQEPFLVLAESGDDRTTLILDEGQRIAFQDEGGARPFAAGAYEACLFTDRGIYRPGERLHAQALIRDTALNAPAPFPLLFRLRGPLNRVLAERSVLLDAQGAAAFDCELPAGAVTGGYTLEAAAPGSEAAPLGRATLFVEDFVPPSLAVAIEGLPAICGATGAVAEIRARHLFGRPAAGLASEVLLVYRPVDFAPAEWRGYTFGDAEKGFDARNVPLGNVKLDEAGVRLLRLEPERAWQPPAALGVSARAIVFEPTGRAVEAGAESVVHLYPRYLGLRAARGEGSWPVASEERLSVAMVTPDGAACQPAAALALSLYRVEWHTLLRRARQGVGYAYETSRTLQAVTTNQPVTLRDGRGEVAVTLPAAGDYVVIVREAGSGVSGSLRVQAAAPGSAWVDWGQTRPDGLTLSLDREAYAVGDTARLLIKSPFAGQALVTLEGRRVLARQVLTLTGNVAEVQLPIRADFLPHVRCSVSVVRPAQPAALWSAHRASGAIGLSLAPPARRLALACTLPAESRPAAPLEIRLVLRDEAGRPVAGQCVVALVDEAICRLTDFSWPEPREWFLAARRPAVSGFDLFNLLLPEKEERIGVRSASGGDSDAALAAGVGRRLSPVRGKRFRPLALWSGGVTADSNGEARVVFTLPEFAGQVRVMALAYDRERMATATATAIVRRPLVMQAGLPRFLAPGDRTLLAIELFNERSQVVTVRLNVNVTGPVRLEASGDKQLELPAGAHRRAELWLAAGPGIGPARVTVRADDGMEPFEETLEIPVRPASGRVLRERTGMLAAGERVSVAWSESYAPGTVDARLLVSDAAEIRLTGALTALLHYPHGCLEQTISRAWPLLVLPDLARRVAPESIAREESDELLRAALSRVLGMQRWDGTFGMWPGESDGEAWPWGTLYASHFLVEARRAGQRVPAQPLEAALTAVERLLAGEGLTAASRQPDSAEWRDANGLRAYACQVLASAGRAPTGWLARLVEEAGLLDTAGRAHVASACLAAGDPRTARALLEATPVPVIGSAPAAAAVGGPARDTALLLLAWCELEPLGVRATELAHALDGMRVQAGWATTQDNALALLALGVYARQTAAASQPFRAAIACGNEPEAGAASGQPFARRWRNLDAPPSVVITNRGPGHGYYSLTVDAVPQGEDRAMCSNGLRIARACFTPEGQPCDPGTLTVGDAVIVRLTVEPDAEIDNLAIEELLPAGLELENALLGRRDPPAWVMALDKEGETRWGWVRHRDARDDRLLLFSGPLRARSSFYYSARAVTPGRYVWPAAKAEAMYNPALRSVAGAIRVEVIP